MQISLLSFNLLRSLKSRIVSFSAFYQKINNNVALLIKDKFYFMKVNDWNANVVLCRFMSFYVVLCRIKLSFNKLRFPA